MMTVQCITCQHYWGAGKCDAFEEGIPEQIASGEYDHTEPHKGDKGIQFEPADETVQP